MSIMDIQGIVPKRKLSIPMRKGFIYLTAVMDWDSRDVLSWSERIDHPRCGLLR
jgi:hypothetical protein